MSDNQNKVTFVLTGPREGFTGILGGRYGFKDGELTVDEYLASSLSTVLCTRYCCNIKGRPPLWRTKNGGSVQVTELDLKTEGTETVVAAEPTTTVKAPPPPQPTAASGSGTGKPSEAKATVKE
jgi:hypothetical protein